MAEDEMLLNLDSAKAPTRATQPKFKGGKWRDRVRANKKLKGISNHNSGVVPQPDQVARSNSAERPLKRQKTLRDPITRSTADLNSPGVSSCLAKDSYRTITSRLFTSNPTPTTDFGDPTIAERRDSKIKPSNAPLSADKASFNALGLSPRIARHLSSKLGLNAPTAIQRNAIPRLLDTDHDAFLHAETGSGKTLAYLLPIAQRILTLSQNPDGSSRGTGVHRTSGLFAIILAPTRELCKQIAAVLEKLLRCASWIVSTTVLGGESKKSEKARIRKGVNILIATPGRLVDHLDHTKVLQIDSVRWLVLDEGDKLMEMGFEDELRTIISRMRQTVPSESQRGGLELDTLPRRRVILLCSATMKTGVQKLGDMSLEGALHISGSSNDLPRTADSKPKLDQGPFYAAPAQLKQSYVVTPAKLRLVTLISYLKDVFACKGAVAKAMIFLSCTDSVDFHFALLAKARAKDRPSDDNKLASRHAAAIAPAAYITSPANPSINLLKLHGNLTQPVRTATLRAFSESQDPAVLIATDIASRGLDVPAVDLVVEYDPAFAASDHVHRVGRTARAGRPGKAVLFLLPGSEEGYVELLNRESCTGDTFIASNSVTPLSCDSVLQNGLAAPITNYPDKTVLSADEQQGARSIEDERSFVSGCFATQSWTRCAELLQLHLEQRLLSQPDVILSGGKTGRDTSGERASSLHLLDQGRRAFTSHVRAYATHVKDERKYFDITQLHHGHVAKSFALRESPRGLGRDATNRGSIGLGKTSRSAPEIDKEISLSSHVGEGGREIRAGFLDRQGVPKNSVVGGGRVSAARRMREMIKASSKNSASEFNIG